MADRTEPATPRQLRRAARRGQVPRSPGLAALAGVTAGVLALSFAADGRPLLQLWRLQLLHSEATTPATSVLVPLMRAALTVWMPVWLAALLAGALPPLLLSRFTWAGAALRPRLGALNPAQGLRRVFGARAARAGVRAALQLTTWAAAAWLLWQHRRALLFANLHGSAAQLGTLWRDLLPDLVLTVALAVLPWLLADLLAEFHQHRREQRMERQQWLREWREDEGNPMVKQRQRALHQQLGLAPPRRHPR